MHEPVEYDQAQVDAYLDYWHQEGEGQAMYDAWRDAARPFDFTGTSYLEEYTRPLRKKTPLMERFARRVECNRDTSIEQEEFMLEPDQGNLQFMLDIDEAIFDDGDYFLRQDPYFLDDLNKVEMVALGEVLAGTSTRHGCFDFWPRLRAMGPTTQMVREARGWWLLANIELEPRYDFYTGRVEEAIAEFHPKIEKIIADGDDAIDGFLEAGWEVHSALEHLPLSMQRDLLSSYLKRDKANVEAICDRAAAEAEAQARKKGHRLFFRGRTTRVWGCLHEPGSPCDTGFLRFVGAWEEVASRESSKWGRTWTGISRAVRHRRGRARCSRRIRRGAGSCRSGSSRDDGGGGDDPDPEPLTWAGASDVCGARTQWDATMTGIGIAIGAGIMDVKGMIIGGFVSYLWARHRWPGDS